MNKHREAYSLFRSFEAIPVDIRKTIRTVEEHAQESVLTFLIAQVADLVQRKTGSASKFRDWIEELADDTHVPEYQPRTLARRVSGPQVNVPHVITERYLAELSRKLDRARHSRARYLDEWDTLLKDAVEAQTILDSAASKKIEIGQASPDAPL